MKLSLLLISIASLAIPAFAVSLDTAATPEPGTFVMLGTGFLGVGLVAWRRNRRK